jgi:hypothetical protein
MAIREKISRNAAPFLEPGEQIQAVFAGQTASQYLIFLGFLPFVLVNNYRKVLATDRRILVLDSGKLFMGTPRSIVRVLPRASRLGPPTGALWYVTDKTGEKLRIHKRFHKDIEAADALAGSAATAPPSPPPPPPPPA